MTNGKKDKEDILLHNKDNEDFKKVIHFLLNPFMVTGLSDKKINKIKVEASSWEHEHNTEELLQLFDYLKKNPHLIAKLEEIDNTVNPEIVEKATPQYDMVRDVYMNQRADQLDREVERLKGVYGEVDEIQLYDMATQMRVPVNQLEVIYKSLAYGKEPVHNTPANTLD
jgi:hypothetical protein